MIKFRMYAEFADGFSGYYQNSASNVEKAEALCMSDIADDTGEVEINVLNDVANDLWHKNIMW